MQKLNIPQVEPAEMQSRDRHHSVFSIDAANVLSIFGLVFGSLIAYQLMFARPAATSVEHAAADEVITHVQAASKLAP